MARLEHAQKRHEDRPAEPTPEPAKADQTKGEKLKADIDDILDEIDGVLASDAAEFAQDYVQKGGE